jgi:hypothetical protein
MNWKEDSFYPGGNGPKNRGHFTPQEQSEEEAQRPQRKAKRMERKSTAQFNRTFIFRLRENQRLKKCFMSPTINFMEK